MSFFSGIQNGSGIWSAGRACTGQACEMHLDEALFSDDKSWFWSDTNERIPLSHDSWEEEPWGLTGEMGRRQPDNYGGLNSDSNEDCMAALINAYEVGLKWHDYSCNIELPYICRDSEELLEIVQIANSTTVSPHTV